MIIEISDKQTKQNKLQNAVLIKNKTFIKTLINVMKCSVKLENEQIDFYLSIAMEKLLLQYSDCLKRLLLLLLLLFFVVVIVNIIVINLFMIFLSLLIINLVYKIKTIAIKFY